RTSVRVASLLALLAAKTSMGAAPRGRREARRVSPTGASVTDTAGNDPRAPTKGSVQIRISRVDGSGVGRAVAAPRATERTLRHLGLSASGSTAGVHVVAVASLAV